MSSQQSLQSKLGSVIPRQTERGTREAGAVIAEEAERVTRPERGFRVSMLNALRDRKQGQIGKTRKALVKLEQWILRTEKLNGSFNIQ